MFASISAQLHGCSISAPVRGDVAFEASVVGAGATGLGGIESSADAAEGIVLVVGPGQILGVLAAGHTFLVPGGQGDDPTTTGASAPRSSVMVRRRFYIRSGGPVHAAYRRRAVGRSIGRITGSVTVMHCVTRDRSGGSAGASHGIGQDGVDTRAAAAQGQG